MSRLAIAWRLTHCELPFEPDTCVLAGSGSRALPPMQLFAAPGCKALPPVSPVGEGEVPHGVWRAGLAGLRISIVFAGTIERLDGSLASKDLS